MQRAIFGSWHLRLPLRKADWSSKSSELMWTVVSFLFGVHDNNTRKECVYVHLSWGPSISALFCTLCKKSPCHNSNAFGCSKTGYTVLRRHSICFFLWPNRAGESFGLKRSLVRGFFFFTALLDVLQWWTSIVMCLGYFWRPPNAPVVLLLVFSSL